MNRLKLLSIMLALAASECAEMAPAAEAERSTWQCEARAAADPGESFMGQGATRAGAASRAQANCVEHLHLACYVAHCAKVPGPQPDPSGVIVDKDGVPHGLGYRPASSTNGVLYWQPKLHSAAPASYDLRTLGWVAPVRDQGQCGSCWAFSITKTLESARLKAGLPALDLSEQSMVSCDKQAYGCNGGEMSDMDFVVKTGLPLESDFPYKATDAACKSKPIAAKGLRWGYVGQQGKQATLAEVKQAELDYGVLSVVVAAGGSDWSNGGHMTGCRTTGQNHMVSLIGWTESGELIGRNSWGTSWGDHGDFTAKLGCDQLGTGSESVSFVVVDGGPAPVPPHVRLPAEIDIQPGTEVMVGVRAEAGVAYSWTADGVALPDTDSMIFVSPAADTVYQITAKTAAGTAQSSVKVHVLESQAEAGAMPSYSDVSGAAALTIHNGTIPAVSTEPTWHIAPTSEGGGESILDNSSEAVGGPR